MMDLWGGVECTVNRVGDRYRDQTRLSGHHDRLDDLALLASLGLKKLRYPVLWERVAPDRPDDRDWGWSDERLGELDRLGIEPIVGLLHHGSGPAYTSLVADDFVDRFADFAVAAARRYPHVTDWTPVNEPLTTSRFSALYGVWYPHARDERLFWIALLNQVEATIKAMRVIRWVNPAARLIQTEDLGQVYSTPRMAESADYLNERRWLGWDLLTGRVGPDHRFWGEAARFGLSDRLLAIRDDPCPPDILGVNYYPTSERFLDHRLDAYSLPHTDEPYHDLEAIRVLDPAPAGLAGLLRQAWDRYRLPVAVTECHLGCTRDEQMRWLQDCWDTCVALREDGVDVRAVTAWALFGSTDWDQLLTVEAGHYEPGAFDVRGGRPRPTALATLIQRLGKKNVSPRAGAAAAVLRGTGWWRRDVRLHHPPYDAGHVAPDLPAATARSPILIIHDERPLGEAVAGAAALRDLPVVLVDRWEIDQRVDRLLTQHQPWAVIDAAHWAEVDLAGADRSEDPNRRERCRVLAMACARRKVSYAIFSSDIATEAEGDALVVTAGAFFSPYDKRNFAVRIERALRAGHVFHASDTQSVMPTYVPDLIHACLDLLIDGERGTWRVSSGEAISPLDLGRRIAVALGLNPRHIQPLEPPIKKEHATPIASTNAVTLLPSLDDALSRHAVVRLNDAFPPMPFAPVWSKQEDRDVSVEHATTAHARA